MIAQMTSSKPASFYEAQAARYIEIDETDEGQLYCTIPSEKDVNIRYRLECKESSTGVEVVSCSCPSKKPCKHLAVVQAFWVRIYKSNQAKQAQQETSEHVEETTACEDVKHPIRIDRFTSSFDRAPVIAAPMLTTNVGMMGTLNVSRGFSLMR